MHYDFITDALPEAEEILLYCQPVRGLYSSANDYSEILSRVVYHDASINPPAKLIKSLKYLGWMSLLDRYVIRRTIQLAGRSSGKYGVNISAESVATNGCFFKFIADELQSCGVAPSQIVIEINEHVLISDNPVIIESIRKLKQVGCKIALDDFGSGWLNLMDIHNVEPDYLKIANPFISEIDTVFSSTIIEAICKVCKNLGILSVAECVENQETLSKLDNLGIDLIQGWYVGHPQPISFNGDAK